MKCSSLLIVAGLALASSSAPIDSGNIIAAMNAAEKTCKVLESVEDLAVRMSIVMKNLVEQLRIHTVHMRGSLWLRLWVPCSARSAASSASRCPSSQSPTRQVILGGTFISFITSLCLFIAELMYMKHAFPRVFRGLDRIESKVGELGVKVEYEAQRQQYGRDIGAIR